MKSSTTCQKTRKLQTWKVGELVMLENMESWETWKVEKPMESKVLKTWKVWKPEKLKTTQKVGKLAKFKNLESSKTWKVGTPGKLLNLVTWKTWKVRKPAKFERKFFPTFPVSRFTGSHRKTFPVLRFPGSERKTFPVSRFPESCKKFPGILVYLPPLQNNFSGFQVSQLHSPLVSKILEARKKNLVSCYLPPTLINILERLAAHLTWRALLANYAASGWYYTWKCSSVWLFIVLTKCLTELVVKPAIIVWTGWNASMTVEIQLSLDITS